MKLRLLISTLTIILYCHAQPKAGRIVWQYHTQNKIVTTPCIYGDNIYYGRCDGNFYCNSLNNGALIWKYTTGKPLRSSATIGEGKIFFGCDDGNIYALDALKGTLQWKFVYQR